MADSQTIPARWLNDVGGDSLRKAKRSKRVSDDDEYLAGCLIALAQSGGGDTSTPAAASVGEKSSELSHRCNICGKAFRTHQALGGHKASHRSKPPTAAADSTGKPSTSEASDYTSGPHPSSSGLHTCATCGKSFSMGQALGGHMRKHYGGVVGKNGGLKSRVNSSDGGNASSVVTSFSDGGAVSYSGGGAPSTRDFDLNLPRSAEDIELDLTLKL